MSNLTTLEVAAGGNIDPANTIGSNWLTVTHCTSEIGSSDEPVCQSGSVPDPSPSQCYIRLDIQVVYANIGSVINPQPIIGSVVFHYQRVTITNTTFLPTSYPITQSVTFQDVSNAPVTQDDQIPRPNVRLPGDFFYPFTLNRATTSIQVFSFSNILIIAIAALM